MAKERLHKGQIQSQIKSFTRAFDAALITSANQSTTTYLPFGTCRLPRLCVGAVCDLVMAMFSRRTCGQTNQWSDTQLVQCTYAIVQ